MTGKSGSSAGLSSNTPAISADEFQRVIKSYGDALVLPVGTDLANDLNPPPARLAQDIRALEMRVAKLEQLLVNFRVGGRRKLTSE